VKVRSVKHNSRKKAFEVRVGTRTLPFPYAKSDLRPTPEDPVQRVFVDPEIGREGFTYVLASGREGTVHVEDVLEYNNDPAHLRDALLYRLTIEAQKRLDKSGLSRREIIRRLGTSPAQLYRLLDQTNDRKSIDQVLALLQVLDCDVDFVVRPRTA
jgi:predicted XRE-type DNA-binding protein